MLEAFRGSPAFVRLWLGALISGLGDGLTWIALQWLILERTNDSGAAVGAVLLCFALPALLTGAPIGRLVDRFGPVPVMVVDNAARAVVVALIPFLDALGALEVWHIFALAALAGAMLPASQVGLRALTPRLVPDQGLEGANRALALTWQIGTVGPPVLAGALIDAFGASSALWVDAVSFLVFALLLVGVPNARAQARDGLLRAHTGFRALREYPAMLGLVGLTVAFYATYGPLESALPIFTKLELGGGARDYGFLWTLGGLGTMAGNLLGGGLKRFRVGVVLPSITLLWGVLQCTLAFAPSLGFVMAWMFTSGIVWGPYLALEATALQRLIPQSVQGRVFGARLAIVGPSAPIGTALGGLMLLGLSSRWVIGLSALACVMAGVVGLASPRLRDLERSFVQETRV